MPDPGDTKAGDRGQGTSSSSGLKGGSGSGNKSGVGGGGGGGGGSTGSRGSSTGGVGAGNGSNAPGNRGAGGSSGGLGGGGQNNGAGRDSSRGLGQGAGGSAIGRGGGNLGGGGQNSPGSSPSSPGGLRGAGGNYGPGSGRPGTGQGGQTVAGGKTDRLGGNISKVGGPGAGGMGAENVRNNSSTVNVGQNSGYNAPGNIGSGVNPTTGQMERGVSRSAAQGIDRYEGIKTEFDAYNARNPVMDMSRPTPRAMADQYSQYRSPPGATPRPGDVMRDDRAPSVTADTYRAPTDVSRLGQMDIEAARGLNALGVSAAAATGMPTAQPMRTSDLWGDDNVPLDPSIEGRLQAAQRPSDIDYSAFDLRGITGPLGEPRRQPTSYGTNYQTAQMARSMYPNSIGRYDQTTVTDYLDKIAGALPGEAHYAKYGDVANYMNNLAKVSLNQMVGGYSPGKAAAALDTTGLRPAAAGYDQPGPHSAGMTENWADKEMGAAYQSQAAQAIQDALFGRGVSPVAMNASNFVAAGTPMVRGVNPVGAPVNGTQFGEDPNWGNRIENRNTQAMASLQTTRPDLSSFRGGIQPASYEQERNTLREQGAGTWTQSYDNPYSYDGEQQHLGVAGGLGISPFNSPNAPKMRTDAGMSNWQRDNQYGGVTGSYDPLSSVTASTPRAPTEIDIPGGDLPVAESYDPLGSIKAPRGPMTYPDWRNIGGFEAPSPSYADDGTWGPRDDRDPLGNWYSDPTPADDPERILEVEDVPPEYISPTTQMPPPQLPEKTWPEKVLEKVPYVKHAVKAGRALTEWEWSRLSEQERADLMQKWATDNASYGRYGDSLGGSRQEPPRTSELLGNGNNAYVPVGAGEPPPDDDPKDPNDPNDPWGGRTRVGNPADPYNYGYGPAFNYFTYA